MEAEELMDFKKPSDEIFGGIKDIAAVEPWYEYSISSVSELFEKLNRVPANEVHLKRELSSSEFLDFLSKQEPEAKLQCALSITADDNSQDCPSKGQSMHKKERNQLYQNVAIDQCDITSSVDYGSRDYYRPSTHTSETPYTVFKENALDELYKASTDTRGNWWEGSLYY